MSKLKLLGLSALGAGGAGIFANRLLSNYRENLVRKAIIDLEGKEVDRRVSEARIAGQEESYRAAIDSNLSRLARYAPDLYASVAAGRKLPQGGVVIGGAPRQDLLNELGRAMADGRFSR